MAGNRLRPRGGSYVLRSPILKWRPNLRVLPAGSKRLCVSSRSIARRQPRPFRSECRRKTEGDMFKSKAPENDKNAAANAAEVVGRTVQQQHSVVEQPPARPEATTKAGTRSSIGAGMAIVGNIECDGPAQGLGQIKRQVPASDHLIGHAAQAEGTATAQDLPAGSRGIR